MRAAPGETTRRPPSARARVPRRVRQCFETWRVGQPAGANTMPVYLDWLLRVAQMREGEAQRRMRGPVQVILINVGELLESMHLPEHAERLGEIRRAAEVLRREVGG